MTSQSAIDAAIAVLDEEKPMDTFTSAIKLLTPSPIRYELIRRKVSEATSERSFDALRQELVEQQPVSPIRPTRAQVDEAKRLQGWLSLFSTDNGKEKKEQKY